MLLAWFIGPALLLALIASGLGILALRRGGSAEGEGETGARREMRIYADQLKEIERDQARGLIAEDEAERLRAETARRLLEADRRAVAVAGQSPRTMRWLGAGAMLAIPLVAGGVYLAQGAPGAADLPLVVRHQEAHPSHRAAAPEWARLASAEHRSARTRDRRIGAAAEYVIGALRGTPQREWQDPLTHALSPAACIARRANAATAHAKPSLPNRLWPD